MNLLKKQTPQYKTHKGYKVYRTGKVKKIGRDVFQKISLVSKKYKYSTISVEGKSQYLHRIVWEAYNGEIPKGYEVDHIDNNPKNNRLDNLRLLSRSDNASRAMKRSHERGKLGGHNRKIKIYTTIDGKVKIFDSSTQASKYLDIPIQSITDNLKGRTKYCRKKYVFKYWGKGK